MNGRSDRNKNNKQFISLILRHKPETWGNRDSLLMSMDGGRELGTKKTEDHIHLTYSEAP